MSIIDYSGDGSLIQPDPAAATPTFGDPSLVTDTTNATVAPAPATTNAAPIDITCAQCGMHCYVPAGSTFPISVSCAGCGAAWTVN